MTDVRDWNTRIIDEFRANEGRVGGPYEGAPILLLHTTGAKRGSERINPMMYLDLGDHRYVFASKAGATRIPTGTTTFSRILRLPSRWSPRPTRLLPHR